MAFVSFSPQLALENSTSIPNIFMEEFLPVLRGDAVKVYLFGLHLCGQATRFDNTIHHFASILGLSEEDIVSLFMHLAEHGLVQVLKLDPIEVRYIPIHEAVKQIKFFRAGQYDEFNANIQAVLEGRKVTPTEFQSYYSLIENHRLEPDALILIAKYCVDTKAGKSKKIVGKDYIVTVARSSFIANGIRTAKMTKARIKELIAEEAGRELAKVAKKTKSTPHKKRDYKKGELDHLYTDLSKEEL